MGSISQIVFEKIVLIPALLLAFTFHEFAHAKVADKLGDKTPRFQGRLTLNPLKHIDPVGAILILLVGFGWAKPVETNPSAYKNYYKDDLKVSLAGPLANLVLAFVGYICFQLFFVFVYEKSLMNYSIIIAVLYMLKAVFSLNISLFVFNLLPIPGLDGFYVLRDTFPDFFYKIEGKVYQYQNIIIILIILAGSRLIQVPVNYVAAFIAKLGNMILKLFI